MAGMRFTPRSSEYKALALLLESGEYDNATQLAKAVVNEVADLLWMRDWYAVSHRGGILNVDYGPFASEAQAKAFCTKELAGQGGVGHIVRLTSPGQLYARINGHSDWEGFCKSCHCPKYDHHHDGQALGKCGTSSCPCKKFKK